MPAEKNQTLRENVDVVIVGFRAEAELPVPTVLASESSGAFHVLGAASQAGAHLSGSQAPGGTSLPPQVPRWAPICSL